MRILITGGAGYIGSVATERALLAGHEVHAVDNLWRGHRGAVADGATFHECDLRNRDAIHAVMAEVRPVAVLHFAAATIVPESMEMPLEYFEANVVGSHNLISATIEAGTPRFIFSSTAAVYGDAMTETISEEHPLNPINPYGLSKLMVEQMLEWHHRRYDLNVAIFRYFNVAGATESCGEDHSPETHLIPVAIQFAQGKRSSFTVFGTDYDTPDGTCIRDYVHVADLVDAHLLATDWLADNRWGVFNLGTTSGTSVREIVQAVAEQAGEMPGITYGERRAGDPARLVADATRARTDLGWSPRQSDVTTMVKSAWDWMEAHPAGYDDRS